MDTDIKDLVLIHISDKPTAYARIEAIEPDVKRGWWRVKLLILTFPLQVIVWILETDQINGTPFTMGGTPVRLERVVSPEIAEEEPAQTGSSRDEGGGSGELISLRDRRKSR
jgi:hypothetical protein